MAATVCLEMIARWPVSDLKHFRHGRFLTKCPNIWAATAPRPKALQQDLTLVPKYTVGTLENLKGQS